jgi:hypothetical protein
VISSQLNFTLIDEAFLKRRRGLWSDDMARAIGPAIKLSEQSNEPVTRI